MEQLIQNLLAVGYSKDKIDRAKKRGTAYQCIRCHNKDGAKVVNIKCRMEEHVIKNHLEKEEVPCRCLLCDFVCLKYEQLLNHIAENTKHVLLSAKRRITDHRPYLWKNSNPHIFGEQDYVVYNQEASLLHFLGAMDQGNVNYNPSPLPNATTTVSSNELQPAIEDGVTTSFPNLVQPMAPALLPELTSPRIATTPRAGQNQICGQGILSPTIPTGCM